MMSTKAASYTAAELEEARRYSLEIAWDDEDNVYVVAVDEIPGLHTHGRTRDEALEMSEEAIATWLAGLRAFGRPVPAPPKTARRSVVDKPPAYGAADAKAIRERAGMAQTVFAAALNVSPETVRAWEQGKNTPSGAAVRLLQFAERQPERLGRLVRST